MMINQAVDFQYIVGTLLGLASAAIMAAIPIVVPAMLKRYTTANTADLSSRLTNALDAAAGAAYQYAVSHTSDLSDVNVHNQAVAVGVRYVSNLMPEVLTAMNISPDSVAAMVTAHLGRLLAVDPSVTAGSPLVATPPINPVYRGGKQ